MARVVFFVVFILASLAGGACGRVRPADMVMRNGKIITVDDGFSIADAVAVRGNRIVAVGGSEEIESLIGPNTRVISLQGATVLPGLIDAHAHLNSLGSQLKYFSVERTASFEDICARVAEEVKTRRPGEWIIGGRWDQTRWPNSAFPVHHALSAVSPHNPVYLSRADGNSAFVNEKALAIAGITKDTPDPQGGVIHRGADGEPSGVLINRAMNLVKAHFPVESEEEFKQKILLAVEDCVKKGLTGVHEAGVTPMEIDVYRELVEDGKLKLRVYGMLGDQEHPIVEGDLVDFFSRNRVENHGDFFFSVRSVKLFFDGALGSRGAAFFEPYKDDPSNKGLLRISPDYIYRVAKAALSVDMSVCTHCIGTRGNRLCLDAYGRALAENPKSDHRFRIEHAQVLREEDIPLFARLGVIPSMQPTHCTSDMAFIEERIGRDRSTYSYAWRSLIEAGNVIPCGSDFPVESNNPFLGIYAAVTRQDPQGRPEGGWFPQQRMTREQAIRGFTIWAAYAAFLEQYLGSIETGKLADFTVIDRDVLTVPAEELLDTQVLFTIVNGKIVYEGASDLQSRLGIDSGPINR